MHTAMSSRSSSCGNLLAQSLLDYRARRDIVVLAIAPASFSIAQDVGKILGVPFDIFLVHEIGVPGREDMVAGAVARGAYIPYAKALASARISLSAFVDAAKLEEDTIAMLEAGYRSGRAPPSLAGTTVILVDGGTSSEADLLTAMTAIRRHGVNGIIAVAPREATPPPETP